MPSRSKSGGVRVIRARYAETRLSDPTDEFDQLGDACATEADIRAVCGTGAFIVAMPKLAPHPEASM